MSNLQQRIITGLTGLFVILFLLVALGVEGVAFFSWVISIGMLLEFCRMFFNLPDRNRKTAIALIVATTFHALHYILPSGLSPSVLGLFPVYAFFIVFVLLVPSLLNFGGAKALQTPEGEASVEQHVRELMALCFGLVYCVWFPLLLVSIRLYPAGKHWVIFTLFVVWANDTLAYFGGKYLGKRLMFESVSPKKTMEGALTGIAGALLVGVLYAYYFLPLISLTTLCVIILTTSLASIFGDLSESLLKRASRKKDSGSLLPGHGGFLDRFDGVIFAAPTVFAWLWFLY